MPAASENGEQAIGGNGQGCELVGGRRLVERRGKGEWTMGSGRRVSGIVSRQLGGQKR